MPPQVGRGAAIGFGAESTWGTAVSRTHWYRAVAISLRQTLDKVGRGVLMESSGSRNMRGHYLKSQNAGGGVTILAGYEGLGLLLSHLLHGTPATTGPSGGLYTHTYKLGVNPPTGLTCEAILGAGTSLAEVFEGCKVNKGSLKISAGGLMSVDLDLIAETSGGMVAAGTPTLTTNEYEVIHHQAGAMTWNSVSYKPISIEISPDNKLTRRQLLGSALTAEPTPAGFVEVMIKVEIELSGEAPYDDLLADTQGDLAVTFTDTAHGNRSFGITAHNCYLTDVSHAVTSVGIIKQTLTYRAESDGTDEGLAIVLTNAQSSAVAA